MKTVNFTKKLFLFALISIVVQVKPNAQNWFDGTPNWYYRYEWYCLSIINGYDKIIYQKDTLIDGINMKLFVNKSFRNEWGEIYEWENNLIMYEENDTVYKYNDGAYKILYDFSFEVGDSMDIVISTDGACDEVITYRLDAIEYMDLYSIDSLRVQKWRKVNGEFIFDDFTIAEKIGALGGFHFEMSKHWNCGIDQCHPYSFECYYNPGIDSSTYSDYCTDLLASVVDFRYSDELINIFPNPNNGIFNLISEVRIEEVLIFNSDGRIVDRINSTQLNQINISNKETGVYFIKLITANGVQVTKSIVKL